MTPNAQVRTTMNGKPVYTVPAKTVLNLKSGFREKLLCDGPTFSLAFLCSYSCSFCYVPALMTKMESVASIGEPMQDIVVRREAALETLRSQLVHANGKARFADPNDHRVVFSSPLVDVAANMDLVRETIEACKLVLTHTAWHIRLLSKSNLLPKIAEALAEHKGRMIYGVSTGTLDDDLARAFEAGTPLVSKRIASLRWLQDNGFRTFGMICPSLPLADEAAYRTFANEAAAAIRADRCEHVWAEVINLRGESMTNTTRALREAGFADAADRLLQVSTDRNAWENYNRATFLAHASVAANRNKLRFLTYTRPDTKSWWERQVPNGAVLLGGSNGVP